MAGVVAAMMWVLSAILNILATPQRVSFDSFGDYLLQIVLLVAFAGTMVTIVAFMPYTVKAGATDGSER